MLRRISCLLCAMLLCAMMSGCNVDLGGGGDAAASAVDVGHYSTPPLNQSRPKVGMTAFKYEGDLNLSLVSSNLGESAGDQMGELLDKSGRFVVIGRSQFAMMLDKQGLSDMVRPGQFVHAGPLGGVDYILIGTITNFEVKKTIASPSFFNKMKNLVKRSSQNKQVIVTATCGVGFSLCDPSTGDIVLTNNSEFDRTAGAEDLGIDVMDTDTETTQPVDLPVSVGDREKIIRFALDDAIRKSLPKIDRFLQSRPAVASLTPPVPTTVPANNELLLTPTTAPAVSTPAGNKKVCPVCGFENEATAKFCARCGAKLP